MAKIRAGFVSNSSSSSFVVARAVVGDEMFAKIRHMLETTKNSDDPDEYDSETYFNTNKNYIIATVSQHDDFNEKFDKLSLKTDQYLWGD